MRKLVALCLIVTGGAYAQDLESAVQTAVEGKRFAMRRAASIRVAQAGDDAVPAIRNWLGLHDRNSLPLELVDAVARSDTGGEAVRALLREWSAERDFYWRAQALGGLARAAEPLDRERFDAAVTDVSHLFRIAGARGLIALGDDADRTVVYRLLVDPDPRTRLRVALALLEAGDRSGVPQIVQAVASAERIFLDDPWGVREANEALRALRTLGHDFTAMLSDDRQQRDAARTALLAWAGDEVRSIVLDQHDGEPLAAFDSGVEIRSCSHGDLFLRWTPDARIAIGLDPVVVVHLDRNAFQVLRDELVDEAGVAVHGAVICDYLRVRAVAKADTLVHHKAAPGSVPESLGAWLKRLAALIEKAEDGGSSSHLLSDRLGQFLPRAAK